MAQLACIKFTTLIGSCFIPHKGHGYLTVLEGAPRTGKTTALNHVSGMLGAVMIPQLDHTMERIPVPHDEVQQWYVLAELARQRFIRTTLNRSSDVIQDRNIISTLAFSYASARRFGTNHHFATVLNMILHNARGKLIRPNVLVVMTVNPSIGRLRRPKSKSDPIDRVWVDDLFLRYHAAFYDELIYSSLADQVIKIDTTYMTPDDSIEAVADTVRERLDTR